MAKKPTSKSATPDDSGSTEARLVQELAEQLESCLPIKSKEHLLDSMDELAMQGRQVPVEVFMPHIRDDVFPIANRDDLVQKLTAGAERAISLARAGIVPVGNPVLNQILSTSIQGNAKAGLRAPGGYLAQKRALSDNTRWSGKAAS